MTDCYVLDDNKIVVQVTRKKFDKNELPEIRYLAIFKPNGVYPPFEYFLSYYPEINDATSQQVLTFPSVDQAEMWVRRNLVEIVDYIGEIQEINFCNLKKMAYISQKAKLGIDVKFLSPDFYKIDVTSNIKTKPLPTKTLYKD